MQLLDLQSGFWCAKVVPEQAMNVISLRYRGEKILREPEDLATLKKDPYIYGIPLLFPPNRLREDSFVFRGKTYRIPYEDKTFGPSHIHGKLTDAPFRIMEKRSDFVSGIFVCDTGRYPFPFTLEVEIALTQEGLEMQHTVKNTGTEALPYALGFHTTFEEKEFVRVSVRDVWEIDPANGLPEKLRCPNESESRVLDGFNPKGESIDSQFTDNGEHLAVIGSFRYSLSDNFSQWVVWNMGGKKQLISLEPQSAPTNGLNMEGMYNVLETGEEERFVMRITHI